ncbi:MAG: DUF4424 family protein [Ruminiclostridium sp.]
MQSFKIFNLATFAIALLLTLFCYIPVYADDTSLGRTPEGVFPLQENDVIMESEQITVDLEKNSVECIFVFHNTGKSKNVYMGFPGKIYDSMDSGLTQDVNLELRHFKTYIQGKELPVTHEKTTKLTNNSTAILDTLNYSEYYTFTVPFKADEKVTVRNTYDFTPTYDSMGYVFSGYVLKTGAMWKEAIGSAKVTFKLGSIQPYQISRLRPSGFKFVENTLVWERSNFEPSYDLIIEYNTYRYSQEYLKNLADSEEKLKQEIKQKIDSYKKIKELSNKGRIDELLALYNKAVYEKDPILALYIRGYLPSDKIPEERISSLGNINIVEEGGYYYVSCDVLGPEAASLKLSISHIEDGKEVQDVQEKDFSSYSPMIKLNPKNEYNFTFTLTDWLDRTEQKTIKYKVPKQAEVSTENQTQSSASSTTSASSDLNTKQVSANQPVKNSAGGSVGNSVDESVKSENNKDSKLIIGTLSAVILIGLLVVSVAVIRRKQQK